MPILDLMGQRQPSETGAIIRGAILAESLKPGTGFDGHVMRIIRCARFEVTGAADYQPPIWTLIEFEVPASSSDALATELADSLLSPGWYANWNSDTEDPAADRGPARVNGHGMSPAHPPEARP
jgi:hypothetical protein